MMGKTPPLKPWQFFAECRKILGEKRFYKIFRVSTREGQRWSADPAHCSDTRGTPLDRLGDAMRALSNEGRRDIAEAVPAMLARISGQRLQRIEGLGQDDRPMPVRYTEAMALCAEFCRLAASGERHEQLHLPLQDAISALEAIYEDRWSKEVDPDKMPMFKMGCSKDISPDVTESLRRLMAPTPWWKFWRVKTSG